MSAPQLLRGTCLAASSFGSWLLSWPLSGTLEDAVARGGQTLLDVPLEPVAPLPAVGNAPASLRVTCGAQLFVVLEPSCHVSVEFFDRVIGSM